MNKITEQIAIETIRKNHCTNNEHCTDSCMHGTEFCAYAMAIKALEDKLKDEEKRMIKENTHIVIKKEDALKYLTDEEYQILQTLQQKIIYGRSEDGKSLTNSYYVCNVDEPYAETVLNAILNGEREKATK